MVLVLHTNKGGQRWHNSRDLEKEERRISRLWPVGLTFVGGEATIGASKSRGRPKMMVEKGGRWWRSGRTEARSRDGIGREKWCGRENECGEVCVLQFNFRF